MAESPLPNYAGCYVCGHENPRGLNIRFYMDGEAVTARLESDDSHAGYPGRVHGGVIAALLDETMGWAPAVKHGRFCVAVELNVRYLKPAPAGEPLLIRGEIVNADRRIWETRGEVTSPGGTVYARATGRYFPLTHAETDEVMARLTVDGDRLTLAEAIRRARGR